MNLLMTDKAGLPTFEKLYNAMLQRVSLKVMSLPDITAYSIMKSRYDFFKSMNDKAVLRENVDHLAKRCHLGRKAMNNALDTLCELGLVTDLTPTLRNKPHCYVVHGWEHREDLLTETTVEEDRNDFFVMEDNSTVPLEQVTMPKGTVDCAKGTVTVPKGIVDCAKGHMSKTDNKTDSHTEYKTDIKTDGKESVGTIENEIVDNTSVSTVSIEDSEIENDSSTVSVSSSPCTSNSPNLTVGDEQTEFKSSTEAYEYAVSKGDTITQSAFMREFGPYGEYRNDSLGIHIKRIYG